MTAPQAAADAPRQHLIRVVPTGEAYLCYEGETLLQGMARLGCKGIPAGCLNGGCGVCKIRVRTGRVRKTGAMSRAHVSSEEEAQGVFLACRVAPDEGLEVEVVGKMRKALSFSVWSLTSS